MRAAQVATDQLHGVGRNQSNAVKFASKRCRSRSNACISRGKSVAPISATWRRTGCGYSFNTAAVMMPSVTFGADEELLQIVAGIVLRRVFSSLKTCPSANTTSSRGTVRASCRSATLACRPLVARLPPMVAESSEARLSGNNRSVRGGVLLHLRQCDAGLNGHGLVLSIQSDDAIEPCEVENQARRVFEYRAAADQSGIAALGNQGDFGVWAAHRRTI